MLKDSWTRLSRPSGRHHALIKNELVTDPHTDTDGLSGSVKGVAAGKENKRCMLSKSSSSSLHVLLPVAPICLDPEGVCSQSHPVLSGSWLPVFILFPPLFSSFTPPPPFLSCENSQPVINVTLTKHTHTHTLKESSLWFPLVFIQIKSSP